MMLKLSNDSLKLILLFLDFQYLIKIRYVSNKINKNIIELFDNTNYKMTIDGNQLIKIA